MAQMTIDGLDELGLSLQKIAELPEETVVDMLNAEAEVAIKFQRKSISDLGLSPHGKLLRSIGSKMSRDNKGNPIVDVFPQGVHHIDPGGTKVRNAEVGFIREYGAKGKNIDPKQWMRLANEKAAKDIDAAALAVYDDFLKSNNL